jgi:hypothetical protein
MYTRAICILLVALACRRPVSEATATTPAVTTFEEVTITNLKATQIQSVVKAERVELLPGDRFRALSVDAQLLRQNARIRAPVIVGSIAEVAGEATETVEIELADQTRAFAARAQVSAQHGVVGDAGIVLVSDAGLLRAQAFHFDVDGQSAEFDGTQTTIVGGFPKVMLTP